MYYQIEDQKEIQFPHSQKYIQGVCHHSSIRIPILDDNMLIVGKTGCGKTTLTKEYIKHLINEPHTYSVFFELKDDYRELIEEDDKVISYYQYPHMNIFQWNMILEIKQSKDWNSEVRKIANMLFSDLQEDKRNKIWVEGAMQVFIGFINTILYCFKDTPTTREVINGMRYITHEQLIKHLSLYTPNKSLLRDCFHYDVNHCDNYQMPRKAFDIMFFLQNVLEKWSGTFINDGKDTIHDFLNGQYGHKLFLLYDYDKKETIQLFYRYFLNYMINSRLSQDVDRTQKIVLVLDEIAELNGDFGLLSGVTIGRGNNLQVILSVQSLEKLYLIAPERHSEHLIHAMLAGFPTIVSFRHGDPQTLETIQKIFGQRKVTEMILPFSRYEQPVMSVKEVPFMSEEDSASLGVGECYMKIRDLTPQRIKLVREG